MQLPLSQLIFTRFRAVPGTRHVITLHRRGEFLEGMQEIGLAANPGGSVTGLQASKGVYLGRDVVGYTWFVGPLMQPSPVHFGDAMQEIERFLWDEIDRQPENNAELPFLVGAEQGATMALAMAAATPDLLSGVVAIDPVLPVVPGWEPPLAHLEGLPILLAGRHPADSDRVLSGNRLAAAFTQWGGNVTVAIDDPGIAGWTAKQPIRMRPT
ncbi:MAG TPA: hypothetical protein VNZ58_09330 [Thermomicrobiales bacterium]|nr:hypothetical protein [Thermomicrobiales bacterium]